MKVLLTGATGFIGQALLIELLNKGFELTVVLRRKIFIPDNVNQVVTEYCFRTSDCTG